MTLRGYSIEKLRMTTESGDATATGKKGGGSGRNDRIKERMHAVDKTGKGLGNDLTTHVITILALR